MRTTVNVFASGYDTTTSGNGCSPDGCMPENTRDNSLDANSRWSCQGDILDDDNNGCWLDYYFDEAQDIVRMRIAFHKGDQRTRTLDVYENGNYHSTITSGGSTMGYQNFMLDTDETNRIRLRLDGYGDNSDVWLSITEVRLRAFRNTCLMPFFVSLSDECRLASVGGLKSRFSSIGTFVPVSIKPTCGFDDIFKL